jgi:hypothetical protein
MSGRKWWNLLTDRFILEEFSILIGKETGWANVLGQDNMEKKKMPFPGAELDSSVLQLVVW